jgi:carboxyvinyl-carboxyphosphonate phosphorylmutase
MKKTTQFRNLIKQDGIILIPGAFCALVARIIEDLGFPAVYMTGYGTSSAIIGRPDAGFVTMTEMVLNAKNIASAVEIPVISDADTGYGNAVNMTRTIREFEQSGIAGVHIEDQTWPKKCGHVAGRKVIDVNEMIGKIKAALDARKDQDFLIIARTDSRSVLGLEEAIDRVNAYAAAGADMVFVDGPQSLEELKRIGQEVKAPLMVNISEGGVTPPLSSKQLEDLGYKIVIYPSSALLTATKSITDLLKLLKTEGTTEKFSEHMVMLKDFHQFIGFPRVYEIEKKYIPEGI